MMERRTKHLEGKDMNPRELRIGNLVSKFGMPHVIDAQDLVRLTQIEVAGKVCIDLTVMLLTEHYIDVLFRRLSKDDESITGLLKQNDSFYMIGSEFWFKGQMLREIYAIHELQNIYLDLTKEELIINNQ